jgi:hypothetical protein
MPKKRKKVKTLYIGYDGSYVLSWNKLVVKKEADGFRYLSNFSKKRPSLVDIDEISAKCVLGAFKLKPYQIVAIKIRM